LGKVKQKYVKQGVELVGPANIKVTMLIINYFTRGKVG
jgi:hypothetical protein